MARCTTTIFVERIPHNGAYVLTGYRVASDATSSEIERARMFKQTYYGYTLEECKKRFRAYVKHGIAMEGHPTVHIRIGSDPIEFV